MIHELTGPTVEVSYGNTLTTVGCTCGGWTRRWHEDYVPPLQEMESDHEAHMHDAGARELMTGALPLGNTPTLDGLVDIAKALADLAKQSVTAMEAMKEFVDVHSAAKQDGVGVLVVRKADGSITSTPNVFLEAGTAVFMDEPGTMDLPVRLTHDFPPAFSPGGAPEYLPRYTIAPSTTITAA